MMHVIQYALRPALGPKAKYSLRVNFVRCYPNYRHAAPHSITSSAKASSVAGEDILADKTGTLIGLKPPRELFHHARQVRSGVINRSHPVRSAGPLHSLNRGHRQAAQPCPNGRGAAPHSITSSAKASSVGGTVSPSSLTVCRLMMNSNFADCCTGKSAGFSPARMRPAYTPT
jgi:hypothetical protein